MAEGVDAIAVDVCDGARRPHLEISANERDADGVPFAERPDRCFRMPTPGAADHGAETGVAEGARQKVGDCRLEPSHQERSGDGTHHGAKLCAGCRRDADPLHIGWAGRKGGEPRERLVQRCRQVLAGDRQLEPDLARLPRPRHSGGVLHLGDRRDTGNRLFGEGANRVRDGTDEPAIDVDRAAAHALRHAGAGQRSPFEPGQDEVALRPLHVAQHTEDVDLELLQLGSFEDGSADANHPGPDLVERHERGGGAG